MGIIEIKNVSKIYFQGRVEIKAVENIDLEISYGETVCLVGPSGAGKSTLLHIIGLMDKPTNGETFFESRNCGELKENELSNLRNGKIGFVFQFYNLLGEFTALENILMPEIIGERVTSNGPKDSLWRKRDEALMLLERVGLKKRLNHFPFELSGGEQQKVAILRAIINSPTLLLADEPTGNLDKKGADEIFDIIFELKKERDFTFVFATHNLDLAKRSQRIINLIDGRIA